MSERMTPRERVLAAVEHRQPDRIPYNIGFTLPARAKLEAHFGTQDLDAALGNHIVRYKSRLPYEQVEDGLWLDEWGVLWDQRIDRDLGVPANQLLRDRSLAPLRLPDPHDPLRYAALPAYMSRHADLFQVFSVSFSLFERAWTLRGMPDLMVDMVEAPEFVDELLDEILAWNLAVLDRMLQEPFDGVLFGDDWGQQRGLLFGLPRWRRFIAPRIARMYERVRASGKVVGIHCCGKVEVLFPDLIGLGVQVFNPFQPEVMDLFEMKRRFGGDLTFYGGVSVQRLLPFGTPQEVRDETRRLIEVVGRGGGFIIAPSHEMPGDIPLGNMLALVETVQAG